MRLTTVEERNRLLATCEREAVHLELRDVYAVHSEAQRFATFVATGRYEGADAPDRRQWLEQVRALRRAGKQIRRARVVSEPVSDYIRFEWAGTQHNVKAGEQVRWLPRRLASPLALPGNDFWLFDDATVIFSVFTGSGDLAERQLSTDPQSCPCAGQRLRQSGRRPSRTTSTGHIDQPSAESQRSAWRSSS